MFFGFTGGHTCEHLWTGVLRRGLGLHKEHQLRPVLALVGRAQLGFPWRGLFLPLHICPCSPQDRTALPLQLPTPSWLFKALLNIFSGGKTSWITNLAQAPPLGPQQPSLIDVNLCALPSLLPWTWGRGGVWGEGDPHPVSRPTSTWPASRASADALPPPTKRLLMGSLPRWEGSPQPVGR